jgi:hypothetical protein
MQAIDFENHATYQQGEATNEIGEATNEVGMKQVEGSHAW